MWRNLMRRTALALALLAFCIAPAAAQIGDPQAELARLKPKDFPTQPIEFVVVYPAGGGMDVAARLLAKHVEKWSGDRIIVNNRTGGDAMLRAQGRWEYTDLEPIAYINTDALIWVGPTEGPYKGMSIKQIVQAAKEKPGTIRVATVPGSMWEYIVEQIEANSGAKFLRVPFQGGGAGIAALVGGNVDVAQGFYSEFRGYLDANKLAPLAVAAPARMDFLKDMPTFNEALGGDAYTWQVIRFVVVPKGTPADRKAYLGAAVKAAMQDPELIAEYKKTGAFFDPKLANSKDLAKDLGDYAELERAFYQKTGRLK